MRLRLGMPVAAVLLAACSGPQAAGHPVATAALKLRYAPGQVITYQLSATTKLLSAAPGAAVEPVDTDLQATETMKVLSVAKDGTATIQATVAALSGTVDGRPLPATPNIPPAQFSVAPDGRIVSAGSAAPGGLGSVPGSDQLTPLLPSSRVRPGDTWTRDYSRPNPFGSGSLSVHSTNRFLRYETISGVRYAVVQTTGSLPLNLTLDLSRLSSFFGSAGAGAGAGETASYKGTVDYDVTSWLNPGGGDLYQVENTSKIDVTLTVPGSLASSIHVSGTVSFNLVREH